MSVTKNVFRLNALYDLILAGSIPYSGDLNAIPGSLYTWGSNYQGKLGDGAVAPRSSPIQIPGTTWVDPRAIGNSTFSRKTDGTLWAWGNGFSGTLGNGISGISNCFSSPIQIPGTAWSSLARGPSFSVMSAIKTDGTLWSWGYNFGGRLGVGDNADRSSPTQVPGTTWRCVFLSNNKGFGIKQDSTLWAWGINCCGSLGDNTVVNKSSPTQIPGSNWVDVSINCWQSYARKSDGTLWAWGNNYNGRLGDGTITCYSSPIQIPGTNWTSIETYDGFQPGGAIALKGNGTLWAWGLTYCAFPGDIYSSPVQIPGTQWTNISSGNPAHIARKSDASLWVWGTSTNTRGIFGNGTGTGASPSSPVQVPGTGWLNFSISSNSNEPVGAALKP